MLLHPVTLTTLIINNVLKCWYLIVSSAFKNKSEVLFLVWASVSCLEHLVVTIREVDLSLVEKAEDIIDCLELGLAEFGTVDQEHFRDILKDCVVLSHCCCEYHVL